MKKHLLLLAIIILTSSCATTRKITSNNIKLKFLDEYVIEANTFVDSTQVGGLSGIDYNNNTYYIIVDTPKKARYYQAQVVINNNKIDTVIFNKTVFINQSANFFKNHPLDPESIRVNPSNNEIIISSEGYINQLKDPSIFTVTSNGTFKDAYKIPNYFTAQGTQKPRNNGIFEGLTPSVDQKGIWVATELPLQKDGAKPKLYPTHTYTRITYYNNQTKQATKQFAYKLDGIAKIPWLYFATNGVTELLEYKKDHFLVLERAYSAGHGSHSNTVKIFDVDASKASNTLAANSLRKTKFIPATKKLVFNFKAIKDKLTDKIIDNIEGMCLGPVLPNGKQTLLVISDNNFNRYTKQITQLILFEITID